MLERLAQREAAGRRRVEALRAELADLTERLAAEQERLSRLEITRTTVLELLASSDPDQAPPPPAGAAGMQVPAFGQGGDGAGRRLPTAYQDVVEVLLDADAFAAARAAFDALTTTLGGAQAGGWTHDQLEDHLEAHGRELLRLLLQDHLDLRALREHHAAAHGRLGPVTGADGIRHRKVEPGHVRHLATVFGTVRVTRCAWRASGARNLYLADAALNLPEHRHSHGLARRAATEAVRGSFDAALSARSPASGRSSSSPCRPPATSTPSTRRRRRCRQRRHAFWSSAWTARAW